MTKPRGARAHACRVHTRVNASCSVLVKMCRDESRHGTHECAMSLRFYCAKHSRGRMLLAEQPGISLKLRWEQTRRSHECERGTQECVRHAAAAATERLFRDNSYAHRPWNGDVSDLASSVFLLADPG